MLAGSVKLVFHLRTGWCQLAVFYWLYVCTTPVLSDADCPPITLGEGSPLYPMRTKGGNITMFRAFHTNSNPHKLNITWIREPSSLSQSSGRYKIHSTYSKSSVNASIALWDLKLMPDFGNYTVIACSNCTCNDTTFVLYLFSCDPELVPQPIEQYERTIITETPLPNVVLLYMVFHGNPTEFFYPTSWTHNGGEVCHEDMDSPSYSCNRTVYSNCAFTANLYIYHPTHKESGNYTVQAIGGGSSSRKATIHIDILNEPKVTSCTPGTLQVAANKHAEFVCHISNYSDYAKVVVVENDQIKFNKSTEQLSFGCQATIPDISFAMCTVHVSTSHHFGKIEYRLCVGYNSSVPHKTALQCSSGITVTTTKSVDMKMIGLIGGGSVMALLLLVVVVVILVFLVVYRKRKPVQSGMLRGPSETSPLLNAGNTPHGYNSTRQTGQLPGTSPNQCTASGKSSDQDGDMELDLPTRASDHSNVQGVLWKTVRSGALEREELVQIATVINQWPTLASHLGISESTIDSIRYSYDYEEQKYQMLVNWYQQQNPPPTRQSLVRIIEEELKESLLAQDVVNIVGSIYNS